MLIFKVIAFAVFASITLAILVRNAGTWSEQFQKYMRGQSRKVLGSEDVWDGSFGRFMSKAIIAFFGLMFLVLVYVAIFSVVATA